MNLFYENAKICCFVEEPPFAADNYPAYVIPRGSTLVVGGGFQVGNTSLELEKEEFDKLNAYGHVLCSMLPKKQEPMDVWIGFRLYRAIGIRFDEEIIDDGEKIIMFNNYGHGGSGWTLCYGVACDTVIKVSKHFKKSKL